MSRLPKEINAWVVEGEKLCRRIAPHELPADVGCYVVARSQLPADFRCAPGCRAWVAPWLDLRLEPWLRSVGRWIGRGFAMVIRDDWFDDWDGRHSFLGTTLHELAHYADSAEILYADDLPDDSPRWQHQLILCLRQRAADADDVLDEDDDNTPRREGHGPRFVRAGCHLRHRAEALGTTLFYCSVTVAGPMYEMTSGVAYERALEKELVNSIDVPLRAILKQPYPIPFAELWASDCPEDKPLPTE